MQLISPLSFFLSQLHTLPSFLAFCFSFFFLFLPLSLICTLCPCLTVPSFLSFHLSPTSLCLSSVHPPSAPHYFPLTGSLLTDFFGSTLSILVSFLSSVSLYSSLLSFLSFSFVLLPVLYFLLFVHSIPLFLCCNIPSFPFSSLPPSLDSFHFTFPHFHLPFLCSLSFLFFLQSPYTCVPYLPYSSLSPYLSPSLVSYNTLSYSVH